MDIGEKMKQLRIEQGLTLEEVGKRVGVGKSTVRKWESGQIANMRRDKIALVAKALGVSPTYIMGWPEQSEHSSAPQNILPISHKRIPVVGQIAAGTPIYTDESYEDYVSVDDDIRCDVAIRVVGDSMQPTFLDGDLVLIRCQDDVDDGQIAAVIVNDEATLKHVYHLADGLQLISENPKYRPMIYTSDNTDYIKIYGLAVAYQRRV